MTFARALALWMIPPITALLTVAIIIGPWWTVAWLTADLATALWFYRLFSRPDWPSIPRDTARRRLAKFTEGARAAT